MSPRLLKVAIVGHTNTGKTSLLRTLTRDATLGEVSNRAATTREVELATLMVAGEPALALFDTPGLEDSSGLLAHLEGRRQDQNLDWTDAIHAFLEPDADQGPFRQEAKALSQVVDCGVALYVVDARDRIHGKHKDELEILGRCARPVLPLLNFVASPEAQPDLWREHLARVNMHAVVAFDTVVLDEVSELRLFEKMRSLLDGFAETLEAMIAERQQRRHDLRQAAAALVADLLIDAAAYRITAPSHDESETSAALAALKQSLRQGEQDCVEALLTLFHFRSDDVLAEPLPIADGKWGLDLFSPESLVEFGITTGGAAASGALAGLAVDAMLGGLALGAATLTGAGVGALTGAVISRGREALDGLRGYRELRANAATLDLLARRQLSLVRALLRRGHASQDRIRLAGEDRQKDTAALAKVLRNLLSQARHHDDWSRFSMAGAAVADGGREALKGRLAEAILPDLTT